MLIGEASDYMYEFSFVLAAFPGLCTAFVACSTKGLVLRLGESLGMRLVLPDHVKSARNHVIPVLDTLFSVYYALLLWGYLMNVVFQNN